MSIPFPDPAPALPPRDPAHHPLRLLAAAKAAGQPLHVSAPMVRYSKLPFRLLLRHYNTQLTYTPMILAKEFIRSAHARASDFTTAPDDRPLVVQFASNVPVDMARAAEMVRPWADGVNINCGCPQSWACQEGVGAALMQQPGVVAAMVRAVKERCGRGFCVSVKIRVHRDVEETLRFVRMVEEAGVDYITVHGRMKSTRSSEPVDLEKIRRVKEAATVPVVANGDAFSAADVRRIVEYTGVDGVMAARGLMTNPALFAGYEKTPWGALERFLDLALTNTIPYRLVQHHVSEMLDGLIPKKERSLMNESTPDMVALLDWLDERFIVLRPGEEGFGECVEVPRRIKSDLP